MKKLFYVFVFFSAFLSSCKKDKNDAADAYANFTQPEITLPGDGGKGTITVKWSLTEWEISTTQNGFISNFSIVKGGSLKHSSTTKITFDYAANITDSERSQDIIVTSKKTRKQEQIKIIQSPPAPIEIAVDLSKQYQKITGFGGMNNVWAAGTLTLDEVEKMYSPTGLGYNMMRIMITPKKSDWGRDVATTLKAQSLGARILASPWTPPAELKSNNSQMHGYLLPEKYPDYVKHLNDFIAYMKDEGITIEAVSIQNEPDWSPEYDGCEWNPQQILDFIKNYGGEINAKVVAAEAVNFKKMFTDPVLNDPIAVNNLDIAGGHLYGGGLVDYPLARAKGKEIWMTEHLLNEVNDGMGWDQALVFAKELNDCMEANFNAYFWWYLKRYYSMLGDGEKGTTAGAVLKRGYVMSHYAKYATGRQRVDVSKIENRKQVYITAYDSPNDISVIIVNESEDPVNNLKINIPVNAQSFAAVRTTENENMVKVNAALSSDKKSTVISVPGRSVVSIKFMK